MMRINKPKLRWETVFFILVVIFSVIITFFTSKNCIDSDAASELILAEHLSKTGQILSTDWIYSTELRVFNTQLIYAPLFWIFSSWQLVRFFGSLILQGILVLSFYAFTHLMKLENRVFFLSAGLFLLPISVCWGRIALYNCYYIPHIAFSLLIVGLIFSNKYNVKNIIFLGVLSFAGGLGGIRQLLMTHIPAVFAVLIFWGIRDCFHQKQEELFIKKNYPLFIASVFSAAMSFAGFMINKSYLVEKYTFTDYSKKTLEFLSVENINRVFYGFFHHFGFREGKTLISVLGILSVLGIFLGIYGLILSILKIWNYKTHDCIQKALPYTFFIAYIVVMLFVFWLIGDGYYYVLYFVPLVLWMVLVFVLNGYEQPKERPLLNFKKIISYLAIVLLLMNGMVNSVYYLSNSRFSQKYEGLYYQNKNQKKEMQPLIAFLEQENYTLGYATFWNGNIITEITNGKIKMINMLIDEQTGETQYYNWLTLKSNRELQNQKEFFLVERSLNEVFQKEKDPKEYRMVYSDEWYVVYDLSFEK